MATQLTAEQLQGEIEKIAMYISQAKMEIAAISLPDGQNGTDKNITHATLELTEVIRHTEEATNTIMDNAEAIMILAVSLTDAKLSAKLGEHSAGIMEACSFQDITGQRISKVLKTLQQIEMRVGNLVKLFGGTLPDGFEVGAIEIGTRRADEDLLNGPQLSKDKPSQDEIDKLFKSS
jgi:chemotaxis protein CheZ